MHEALDGQVKISLDQRGQPGEIDAPVQAGQAVELQGALGDADRQVADALDVDHELEGHGHEAKVGRQGMAGHEDVHRELVDLVFVGVDELIAVDHLAGEGVVLRGQGLHRERNLVGRARRHRGEPPLERPQLMRKFPVGRLDHGPFEGKDRAAQRDPQLRPSPNC